MIKRDLYTLLSKNFIGSVFIHANDVPLNSNNVQLSNYLYPEQHFASFKVFINNGSIWNILFCKWDKKIVIPNFTTYIDMKDYLKWKYDLWKIIR